MSRGPLDLTRDPGGPGSAPAELSEVWPLLDAIWLSTETNVSCRTQLIVTVSKGEAVLWMSSSGATQFFALVDGVLTRTREGRGSVHAGDGRPLLFDEPSFATACGCGDRMGYRSTPPLLVAAIGDPDDVKPLLDDALERVWQLTDGGHSADPKEVGHPPAPCGALYCLRITLRLIETGR